MTSMTPMNPPSEDLQATIDYLRAGLLKAASDIKTRDKLIVIQSGKIERLTTELADKTSKYEFYRVLSSGNEQTRQAQRDIITDKQSDLDEALDKICDLSAQLFDTRQKLAAAERFATNLANSQFIAELVARHVIEPPPPQKLQSHQDDYPDSDYEESSMPYYLLTSTFEDWEQRSETESNEPHPDIVEVDGIIPTLEIHSSEPDSHCPECGADVDENCEGSLDNCARHGTGDYAPPEEDSNT